MFFCDMHFHALYGVDDGPGTEADMYAMAEAAYAEGTRTIFLPPHYHPGYYGDNMGQSENAFECLCTYCRKKFPDLILLRGNELHYSRNCISWLESGMCRTMNNTRYVLVDFPAGVPFSDMSDGLDRLLNRGYQPILAHAERYRTLDCKEIEIFRQNGILIQINAQSLLTPVYLTQYMRAHAILAEQLADFVSSDAHDLRKRPPQMQRGYDCISKKYGTAYAEYLCRDHAIELWGGSDLV